MENFPLIETLGDLRAEIRESGTSKPEYHVHYFGPNDKHLSEESLGGFTSQQGLREHVQKRLSQLRDKHSPEAIAKDRPSGWPPSVDSDE
jgi:hypothetical protein